MSDHSEYREEFTDERPQSYDHSEPSYTIIAALGVTTVIALLLIGIGVQFYYERTEEARVYEKVLSQPSWTLQDLRNKEAWELSHYTYLDKTKGTVRIPIDQAMTLVAKEAAENRLKYPTNAYAVKTDAQLATSPAVSQAGVVALEATQQTGIVSSPNVQQSTVPQQPNK
jgi:hypothetical protein